MPRPRTTKHRASDYRIKSAAAVDDHQVEVRWTDGLSGVIDFADLIASGGVFDALRDPARFRDVRVADYGHNIYWLGEDGYEIDICPDVLRAKVDPKVAQWIAQLERQWYARQKAE